MCEAEGVTRTPEGLEALIFTAEGDMRNALNNLQVLVAPGAWYKSHIVCLLLHGACRNAVPLFHVAARGPRCRTMSVVCIPDFGIIRRPFFGD